MALSEKIRAALRRKPRQMDLEDYLGKLMAKGLHPDGTPVLDPTPIAPPIGYTKHPSMVEIVRNMVQSQRLADEAAAAGAETFEESEDFDIGDDPELLRSEWENDFDPPLVEILEAGRQVMLEREAVAKRTSSESPLATPGKDAERPPPSDGPDA